MLTVITIIGLLVVAVVPVITSITYGRNVAKAGGDIASLLEQAKSYAMANNTYVYVGFYEADAAQSEGLRPQPHGTGRLYVGVISTRDGTTGYSAGSWPSDSSTNTNVADITQPHHFEGVHLVDPASFSTINTRLPNLDYSTDSSGMPNSAWVLGTASGDGYASAATAVPFNAPSRSAVTQAACTFLQVVQFTPSGSANIITSVNGTSRQTPFIQFGLVPVRGNQMNANTVDCVGIQIDGLTGVVRMFRAGQT